ncbi:MAG: SEC-C metal-binding domain-containing protein, partial [Peptococcaceae bacterium]|nr:SEC-C metal-binding domain-containing protein [Peptococcaceae bacterium]
EKEAEIVSSAGQPNMVTIATNMAGRGTDIVLGQGIQEVGGLHIIGTERHESRRIDNQLRGRAGRQGDPGSSQFYISMEDDLMRLFGENIGNVMDRFGMDEDMSIESKILSRSIESAQKRVENRNYEIRKNVLNYDDVMNKQREVIYTQRREVLYQDNLKDHILGMIETIIEEAVDRQAAESPYPEEWDLESLLTFSEKMFLPNHSLTREDLAKQGKDEIVDFLLDRATDLYNEREEVFGAELMRGIERAVMLQIVDNHWKDHLDAMDMLREGIGLRAYGQRDPLVEYRNEAYDMFQNMISSIQEEVVTYIMRVTPRVTETVQEKPKNVTENLYNEGASAKQPHRAGDKIGRNDPCPCGSGKKYKKCCGS